MSVTQSCQNVTSQPASCQQRPRQAVSLAGSCQSMTSPQPVPSARSPCRHTRSPQAAHDPVPPRSAPGRFFRVPPAGCVARSDSDLRRWLGGRCASVRLTRPERLRRLQLRVRRAPPGRGRAEPSDRAGPGAVPRERPEARRPHREAGAHEARVALPRPAPRAGYLAALLLTAAGRRPRKVPCPSDPDGCSWPSPVP